MKSTKWQLWQIPLKGMAMGLAEIIPGVSGGTIAFVSGIYERLILAIKSFDIELMSTFKESGMQGVWKKIDGFFLVLLFSGMFIGLVIGAFLVTWLLQHYPLHLWGFFFGLIFASFFYIVKDISKINWKSILLILAGGFIAYYITTLSPAEGNTALWFVGFSGMIAISALLLPGISGSFILLLLGMYTYILPIFKELLTSFQMDNLIVIIVFLCGCLLGVVIFSRIISWTFKRYRDYTLALLSGFILGSLNKIWPWRLPSLWMDAQGNTLTDLDGVDASSKLKILKEENFLPHLYPEDSFLFGVTVSILLGAFMVYALSKMEGDKHAQPYS